MESPFVKRTAYRLLLEQMLEKNREIVRLSGELDAVRGCLRGFEKSSAETIVQLRAELTVSRQLLVERQKDLAELRSQRNELVLQHREELVGARADVHKLVDWITTGTTGNPVFDKSAPPIEITTPPAVNPGGEVPQSELSDAIRTAGRRPREIVRHIERQREKDFSQEVAAVVATLDNDRDEVIASSRKA
jgi:F0F1-type ATP synthase membrane subunit b/b'